MKSSCRRATFILVLAIFAVLFPSGLAAAADKQTLTGVVSDAMCGTQHMQGTPADCTRACVGHGAKYTLVVGDKIYSLNTTDKALLAVLSQQAGKNATVSGTVNGVGVEVSSVAPAK
jgi:hypothetical protein